MWTLLFVYGIQNHEFFIFPEQEDQIYYYQYLMNVTLSSQIHQKGAKNQNKGFPPKNRLF